MAHRRRRRYRRRRARQRGQIAVSAAVVAVAVAVVAAPHQSRLAHPNRSRHTTVAADAALGTTPAVATAIAYARRQLGKPYLWGGTGPDAYDCSGLVQQAYFSAGITAIPRTSQQQWAWGPQVGVPEAGDLVFFAGGDGTPAAPGHVGLVIDPAKHLMIEAYATGFPIRVSTYGLPSSSGGDSPVIGFTAPWKRAGGAT